MAVTVRDQPEWLATNAVPVTVKLSQLVTNGFRELRPILADSSYID